MCWRLQSVLANSSISGIMRAFLLGGQMADTTCSCCYHMQQNVTFVQSRTTARCGISILTNDGKMVALLYWCIIQVLLPYPPFSSTIFDAHVPWSNKITHHSHQILLYSHQHLLPISSVPHRGNPSDLPYIVTWHWSSTEWRNITNLYHHLNVLYIHSRGQHKCHSLSSNYGCNAAINHSKTSY